MSAYTEQQTQITDVDVLKECLKEKGYPNVEEHTTPQNLVGYHGDKRADKAEVIIRRQNIGSASNDIGFKKQADGTYKAIISDFDKGKHNTTWLSNLKKLYAEKKLHKVAKQSGMTFIGKTTAENGSFKLQFVKS